MPSQEWICLECRTTGTYADLRKPFARGVDTHCGAEVKNIEDVDCKGCEHEGKCNLDYRTEYCYT